MIRTAVQYVLIQQYNAICINTQLQHLQLDFPRVVGPCLWSARVVGGRGWGEMTWRREGGVVRGLGTGVWVWVRCGCGCEVW